MLNRKEIHNPLGIITKPRNVINQELIDMKE